MRRLVSLFVLGVAIFSADPPIVPLGICEVLRDLAEQEGKNVAVLGRYSFRQTGRWVGEQVCGPPVDAPPLLWLMESATGPTPPGNYELDGAALRKKWSEMQRHTSLGK